MKITVVTLRHETRHGAALTVHANEEAAKTELYGEVAGGWANVFCVDGADCGVDGCTGVPDDLSTINRDDAIDFYFSHHDGSESYDLIHHDVTVPAEQAVEAFAAFLRDDSGLVQRERVLFSLNEIGGKGRVVTVDLPEAFDKLFSRSAVAEGDAGPGNAMSLHHAYTDGEVVRHGSGRSRRLTFRLSDVDYCCTILIEHAEQYLRTNIADREPARAACRKVIGRCNRAIAVAREALQAQFPDH
jgi:hypothetical protein